MPGQGAPPNSNLQFAARPLHGKVENVFQFKEEVRETITSVFEKHRSGQDVFQKVCCSRIEVGSVIEAEISMVLKSHTL